jgi:hypothetical protein
VSYCYTEEEIKSLPEEVKKNLSKNFLSRIGDGKKMPEYIIEAIESFGDVGSNADDIILKLFFTLNKSVKRSTVNAHLAKLVKEGRIRRSGYGVYKIKESKAPKKSVRKNKR